VGNNRYDELLRVTGSALVNAAPPGWRRIDLIARIAGGAQDFGLSVITGDLSYAEMALPPQAAQALAEVRHVTYRPETGAWFSARYVVDPPSAFQVFYNFDHDPAWQPPIAPGYFQQDLAAYPRPPERVPEWLRRVLDPNAVIAEPPARPLTFEDRRDLHRQVTDVLLARAPADRDEVRVMYRAAGSREEVVGHVLGLDGQLREWEAPPEVAAPFRRMRADMYQAGVGTWSAVSAVLQYPARLGLTFLSPEDPRWRQPPSRYDVLDELEKFPRAPEHVPEWMKSVLPTADRVAEVAGRFRQARIFDHRDAAARPVVNRPPVPDAEREQVLAYLTKAAVLLAGRGFDQDLFVPDSPRDVPAGYHTDGTWIWPACVPHYLAKHGVPPEADLVAHIRANGFTPPRVEQDTQDAAYTALTGEVPAAPARPELSDRDRRTLAVIERRVSEAGAVPAAYRILDSAEGATCLERVGEQWQVAVYERGTPRNPQRFSQLWDAGAHLLGVLAIIPSGLRAGGGDQNTAAALNDWPIQPLQGEPPLTLLSDKHIAVLMPGRELVRYGSTAGNLTFAGDTEFGAMSIRAEREEQGPNRYRVVRALHTVSGRTVPWHGQPGGGTAYLLPRSVAEHVSDGSLEELA
jgi:hypothetical protein